MSQEVSVMYMCAYYYENLVHIEYSGSRTCTMPFNVGLSVTRHFQCKNSLCLTLKITNPTPNPTTWFLCPSLMVVLCLNVTWETYASNGTVVGDVKGKTQYITAALARTEINFWTRWVKMCCKDSTLSSFYGFFGQNSNLILGGRFKFTIDINIFSAFSPFSEGVASPFDFL